MEDDELLAAAETLRPEIPALAGEETAAQFDVLWGRLRAGEPVGDDLFELLTGQDALRERLNELLPPEPESSKAFSYLELPGQGEIITAAVYVCPRGDYRYPLLEIGEPVPVCPRHALPLVAE